MKCKWNKASKKFQFQSEIIKGEIAIVEGKTLCNHRLANTIHIPTNTRVTTEDAKGAMPQFGLSLFRVLARSAYLTELRATQMSVIPRDDGIELVWEPTIRHQAKISAIFVPKEPNIIDLEINVEGYAHYQDYEILLSNYVAPGFTSGIYIRKDDFHNPEAEKIEPKDNLVYHGMFNFFPRDERAANILNDGRGQRGRWYWRVACGRLYAYPMNFFSNDTVDILMMGRREDVSAVGVTYAGDESTDGVADHRSQYISLFGKDLHPGEGWRTNVRLVIDAFAKDSSKHFLQFTAFEEYVKTAKRQFEIEP